MRRCGDDTEGDGMDMRHEARCVEYYFDEDNCIYLHWVCDDCEWDKWQTPRGFEGTDGDPEALHSGGYNMSEPSVKI